VFLGHKQNMLKGINRLSVNYKVKVVEYRYRKPYLEKLVRLFSRK